MINPIILWVPGTSNHHVHPSFATALPKSITPVLVDYEATWKLDQSVADGVTQLKKAIDDQRKRHPHTPIRIAGESQGALIISTVMMDEKYRSVIDKVALLGNPGIAPLHFGPNDKYLEIDHALDPATFMWTDSPDLLLAVDRFVSGDLNSLKFLAPLALHRPVQAAIAGFFMLRSLPLLDKVIPDVHNYSDDMPTAAEWLLDG